MTFPIITCPAWREAPFRPPSAVADDLYLADLLARLMAAESRAGEAERIVTDLRAIVSGQARLLGDLFAQLSDDEGGEP